MGLFGFGKKNKESVIDTSMSNEEKYGKAWLLIVGQKQRELGFKVMQELDQAGFIEGTIALSMFLQDQIEKKRLVKKAADAGNVEGLWEYCSFLPHSYCPDPNKAGDALWEKYCTEAAEGGSVDAMNELGNVFHRRSHYAESMYWYAMANANGQADGKVSMAAIAKEWVKAGCPREFQAGSPKFDKARHICAIGYLEIHSGNTLTAPANEIVKLTLEGVPIAGYLAGDVFETLKNDQMAFKMYNALAFKNDPHALRCYADMLYYGKGVERNQDSAFRMYRLAAEKGERSAMFVMGEITKAQNKNLAAYWYGVSHTRGYELSLQRLVQLAQY